MMPELRNEARLSEAVAILRDVNDVVGHILATPADGPISILMVAKLRYVQEQAHTLVQSDDGPPIAEVVQCAQDFREAVGRVGFNITDPSVAMTWADLMTSLAEVFDEASCSAVPP